MNFSLIITSMLVVVFTGESVGRAINENPNSQQPTNIVRDVRSVREGKRTGIVREERSAEDKSDSGAEKTEIARSERSPADANHAHIKTMIVREGRAMDISSDVPVDPNTGKTRLERSPAFSPFGRAEGEASAPRRRARSPAFSPFGRAEGEASAPRRRARSPLDAAEETRESVKGTQIVRQERSPAFSPFGRAEGEASAPRRRARSPVFSPWASAPRRRY